MTFVGKVVLITGSSSGIGAAIAIHFAKLGAYVVVTGTHFLRTQRVANQCRSVATDNTKIVYVIADLTKDCDVRRLLGTTISEFGKLDLLVNNANVCGISSIDDPKAPHIYDHIFNVNVRAVFLLCQLSVSFLERSNGSIINISSKASMSPIQDYSLYCMSKSALDMLTKCLSLDLKSRGIRVNSINPDAIRLKTIISSGLSEVQTERDEMLSRPLGRLGEPEEIARTVEFLASKYASHISGVTTSIDGGALYAPYSLSTNA